MKFIQPNIKSLLKIALLALALVSSYYFFKGPSKKTAAKIATANTNSATTKAAPTYKLKDDIGEDLNKTPQAKQDQKTQEKQKVATKPIKQKTLSKKSTPKAASTYKIVNQDQKPSTKKREELGPKIAKTNPPTKEIKQQKPSRDRTQGHYLGASYNYVETSFHDNFTSNIGIPTLQKPSSKDNGYGLGISYKYAFNFNKFYIAPGVLWEKYWNKVQGNNNGKEETYLGLYRDLKQLDLRYRYGITSDFGYDFSKLFSGYVTVGYVANGFKVKDGLLALNEYENIIYEDYSTKRLDANLLFGAGFNFRINDQLSLNLEANTQKFKVKTRLPTIIPDPTSSDNTSFDVTDYNFHNRFSGRINVFKIGLMYNF